MKLYALVATVGLITGTAAIVIQDALSWDHLQKLPHGVASISSSLSHEVMEKTEWSTSHKASKDALPLVIWHGLGDKYDHWKILRIATDKLAAIKPTVSAALATLQGRQSKGCMSTTST